jgi:hypothetical protein
VLPGGHVRDFAGRDADVVHGNVAARAREMERVLQSTSRNVGAQAEECVGGQKERSGLVQRLGGQDCGELAL